MRKNGILPYTQHMIRVDKLFKIYQIFLLKGGGDFHESEDGFCTDDNENMIYDMSQADMVSEEDI